jgi:hypothetical protein
MARESAFASAVVVLFVLACLVVISCGNDNKKDKSHNAQPGFL